MRKDTSQETVRVKISQTDALNAEKLDIWLANVTKELFDLKIQLGWIYGFSFVKNLAELGKPILQSKLK